MPFFISEFMSKLKYNTLIYLFLGLLNKYQQLANTTLYKMSHITRKNSKLFFKL